MILRALEITKNYDRTILDSLSFEIKKGEFITIFGRSGSGKSTLLHILGGLLKPDEGKIIFETKDVYQNSEEYRKKEVGFVFQFFHLINVLNVYENITLSVKVSGNTFDKNELKSLISTLGLKDKIYSSVNTLSGGEKQRVALARALLKEPKIIFCDEPTGNLDTYNSEIVFKALKEFNNKGKTVVLVTHNPKLLYGKIYKLENGKLGEL